MAETASPLRLTTGQTMLLVGVIPIVIVGVLLPVGLIAAGLALSDGSAFDAIKHGELFLAAANAALAGCVALGAARTDRLALAVILAFLALLVIVIPSYVLWAILTVKELRNESYSESIAVVGGGGMTLAAIVVALGFVRLTCPST
jgi:FlaA1/EpsC-like NDP-sugar epimerase